MEKLAVERSIWIGAPRERVWQAITEPEQLAQWFLPPALGMTLTRDGSDQLRVGLGPMEVAVARLEGIDPPRRVTLRGLPDRLLAATFALEVDQGGTRVTVTMSGFDALTEAAGRERLDASGTSWEKALANLKAHVEGAALPFPEGYVSALLGYRREAKDMLAVERSIWIKAPRERVWQAITDPKQIQQWYSPGTEWRASGQGVGGRLSVVDPATGGDTYSQVIEVFDPPRQFVTRTAPEPPEPPASRVTRWTLEDEQGGTRLTLTYSGYEREPADSRHNNMEQNAFGYGMMLENVQAQLEGRDLPFPGGF